MAGRHRQREPLRAPPLLALALAACHASEPAPAPPPLGKVLASALAAAERTTSPWRCAAEDLPALPDTQLVASWQLVGHTLRTDARDAEIVIGVIADAAGAAPPTLAALGRLRRRFEAAKPDLVLSLGSMGATRDELEATLGALGHGAAWPVVALPGDLESTGAHVAAIETLRARGDAIVDGRLVRWIELPGVTIGTLPGAGAAERLAAGGEGCAWRADDVARVYAELTARPGIRVVASAEPPRHAIGGEPVGELALAPDSAHPIELAIHGPAQGAPTPARSGRRDGAGALLSPGTSDATTRLPRTLPPAAAVLVIRGQTWAWRPIVDAS